MKRQKIKRGDYYGETIFNIASYNMSRNYAIGKKNTKRVISQYMVIIDYLESCKARQKGMTK